MVQAESLFYYNYFSNSISINMSLFIIYSFIHNLEAGGGRAGGQGKKELSCM